MPAAQGIVRISGVVQPKTYYTAYYRNNAGNGAAGPGNGFRASQWMSGVYLTESPSGQYTVSVNSDNFLGAGATVNAGDELVVLFWQKVGSPPAESGGHFYAGQSRTDGKGGVHDLGFKYDNGDAAVANYGQVDRFRSQTFVMSGQSWNATPGGIGGDANGDVDLLANAGPSAVITGASTNQAAPTAISRGVAQAMPNGSADTVANRLYSFNSQILFQQSSAAHRPTGGVQAADGTDVDGSRFTFYVGLTYGRAHGAPTGGDTNSANESIYAGPQFRDHSHTFPHIDLYRVDLTTKDDNDTGLTATGSFFYRTAFRAISNTFAARRYVSWTQFLADPSLANANWSSANPNTINDVVRVTPNFTNPDQTVGRINSVARGGIESKLTGTVTLDGSNAFVIAQPNIDDGLPSSGPFGFLVMVTQGGQDVRHVYEIVGKAAGQITIDTRGSTEVYTARDWYFLASEPAGGTDLHWDWEVRVSNGAWGKLGKARTAVVGGLGTGTIINQVGIGEGVIPGWWFRVIDGAGRGAYRVQSVPSDDQIVLTGAGLSSAVAAGDSYEIGCHDSDALWAQAENDELDFRLAGTYSTGWASTGAYVHQTAYGPSTNTGSVNNLPPKAEVLTTTDASRAQTYNFDGRLSIGTQTTFEQSTAFASPHVLDGTAACVITDTALDTGTLRDGHAWLLVTDVTGIVQAIFPIVDIDRETPNADVITIDTRGSTASYPAGTKFKTTNVYEIEGSNLDNDVVSYSWELRSAATAQLQPTSNAEFTTRFDRADGSGTGALWSFTYPEDDDGRFACVRLTVTDAEGATSTTWIMFSVTVSGGVSAVARRIEWD